MPLSAPLQDLHDSLSCCKYRGDQHSDLLIEENDAQAVLKKVTIKCHNGDWFSFDPDKGRGKPGLMSALLATGDKIPYHRACDAVILILRETQLTAIYFDMKSGNPIGYAGQFKSTRQFVRYVIGLLNEFHDHNVKLTDERFVVLYGGKPIPLNKKPTVPTRMTKTAPDDAHKREVPNGATLYLREFLD